MILNLQSLQLVDYAVSKMSFVFDTRASESYIVGGMTLNYEGYNVFY